MNALHIHMYIVGCISLAQLLTFYPAENSVSVSAKVVEQNNKKGENGTSGKGK